MVCLGCVAAEGLQHTCRLQMPASVDASDDSKHALASVLQQRVCLISARFRMAS